MALSNQLRRVFLPFLTIIAIPALGQAAPIILIDVSGPLEQASPTGPDVIYDGVAATFTLGADVQNASLSLDVLCLTPSCNGQFFLTSGDVNFGSPSLLSLIDVKPFDVGASFGGAPATGFSGLNLSAGNYSLQMTFEEGLGGWLGTQQPILSALSGFSVGSGISYRSVNPLLPGYSSSETLSYTPQFRLTGEIDQPVPPSVPLPASALLLLGGLGLLVWYRQT